MTTNALVPSARLLWLTGLIVVPASTVAAAAPGWSAEAGLVLLASALVASLDAFLGWPRLAAAVVEAPSVVHGAKGRVVDLVVGVTGLVAPTRLGLSLPDAVRCDQPVVALDSGGGEARWPLRVLRRGRHRLEHVYLEVSSPMGLWERRRSFPMTTELHVYPDLRRERGALEMVFLNRGGPGNHARLQLGKGREFDHLRDYAPGDDFGDIHWKSTARRGFPVTKTFQIERTREVYAVIDHSRLSARTVRTPVAGGAHEPTQPGEASAGGTEDVTIQLERSIESALALGLAAERQHDLFGLITFADQVTGYVRSGGGRAHFGQCRNAIFALEPRLVAPNFEELCVFLRRTLTRRSLIVILTDLSDPLQCESFVQDLKLVARHHLILVSMIRPPHAAPLFSRSDTESLEDVYRDLGGHFLWHDLQETAAVLARQGVRLSLPDSAGLTVDLVSRYMEVKNRQVL